MSTSKDWMVYFWKCENKPENKRKFSELKAVGASVLAGAFMTGNSIMTLAENGAA